ncbi:MAG: cell wall hydrolase [Oscillospiraceae bacterium]|nr:cell wall hydrolase [Oscillospiraceae bacterium]
MKKILIFMLSLILLAQMSFAANVTIDGENLEGARLINSVTYVPMRTFAEAFDEVEVAWNNNTKTATVKQQEAETGATIGRGYIESRGRVLYSGNENLIIDGSTYIPVRPLAKALGASVTWDNATKTAEVRSGAEKLLSADEFYNASDLYWLAKIINAESEGESLTGKLAVGNVVLNRVESPEFPNNVYDVVFDKKGGVQFTPVANGSIHKEPGWESYLAAKICLESYKVTDKNILFFLNPAISTSTWVPNNRDFVMSVGNHDFYA